jgi:hypothetical protein
MRIIPGKRLLLKNYELFHLWVYFLVGLSFKREKNDFKMHRIYEKRNNHANS